MRGRLTASNKHVQRVMRWKKQHPEITKEAYRRQRRKKYNERQYLLAWLKDVPCKDCGERLPSCCMDFHHMGHKTFTISKVLLHIPIENLLAEVSQCIVLCANCHRIRTARDNGRFIDGLK